MQLFSLFDNSRSQNRKKCHTNGPHKWAKMTSIEQAKHPKGNSVAPTNLCVV